MVVRFVLQKGFMRSMETGVSWIRHYQNPALRALLLVRRWLV